jgi:formylglycine-generating enzyme required for sulfatase activity
MIDNKTPVYSVNGKTDPDTWNYKSCNYESISGTIAMNIKASGYRLPTEAEWEFAAWGGKKRKGYKYSGSDNLNAVAWYIDNSGSQTHDVATKAPNELGIYDMSGNVWEWCWDWYGSYSSVAQTNPVGPSSGDYRIIRGGSWSNRGDGYGCRVAGRSFSYPFSRGSGDSGFRLVRSAN